MTDTTVEQLPVVQTLLDRRPDLADMTQAGAYVAQMWGTS